MTPSSTEPSRHGATQATEKRPVTGSQGMAVSNHPLASAAGAEVLAEALKVALADRAACTGDPDLVAVPVARLLSADFAARRRAAPRRDRPAAHPALADRHRCGQHRCQQRRRGAHFT